MNRIIFTMVTFLFAVVFIPALVHAEDLNDILMLNNHNCNNYGDQMQCTGVAVDYCCFAAMPFCWVAINPSANALFSLTAWSNTNSCPIGSGAPAKKCTEGYCGCLDANTAGSTNAACSALWSYSNPQPPRRAEARSQGVGNATCRPADTLIYYDTVSNVRRVIKNITHENFEEVVDFYFGRNYEELAKLAVPL